MKREPGFYWVKFWNVWTVAEYYNSDTYGPLWAVPGWADSKKEEELDEINETRIIAPDEQVADKMGQLSNAFTITTNGW